MITLDYVYGCDTCLVAEVVEVTGALGQRPVDPLTHLPPNWTYVADDVLCPECSNKAGGSGGDGPRTDPAPNKEVVQC